MKIEGEATKRFKVVWGLEVQYFDTASEVLAATQRLDRVYEIYDGRKKIEKRDLED
jgi:hypothetical protein